VKPFSKTEKKQTPIFGETKKKEISFKILFLIE